MAMSMNSMPPYLPKTGYLNPWKLAGLKAIFPAMERSMTSMPQCWPQIGKVRLVQSVPEPSTFALVLTIMFATVVLLRRRK